MKIIGINKESEIIISEMSYEEFAKFAGFDSSYSLKDKIDIKAGKTIDVDKCYKDAELALDSHKEAIGASKRLKKASSIFLSFFYNEEEK